MRLRGVLSSAVLLRPVRVLSRLTLCIVCGVAHPQPPVSATNSDAKLCRFSAVCAALDRVSVPLSAQELLWETIHVALVLAKLDFGDTSESNPSECVCECKSPLFLRNLAEIVGVQDGEITQRQSEPTSAQLVPCHLRFSHRPSAMLIVCISLLTVLSLWSCL